MEIEDKIIKEYLKNVYFINGTAFAGKSTVCKILAKKYDMILCEENYHIGDFLKLTTSETHPNLNYHKNMTSWEEFVTRDIVAYDTWLDGVSRELVDFEITELISISKNKKVIVDTNIPIDVLKRISDENHVLFMVSTTEIAMEEFFNRSDKEKQFILGVISQSREPQKSLDHYKKIIAYVNRQEKIDMYINSGFQYIQRTSINESIDEKVDFAEKVFKLK